MKKISSTIEKFIAKPQTAMICESNRKKYIIHIDGKKECRSASLNLEKIDRALRSIMVKRLDWEGLILWHDYEQKKMLRFLTNQEIINIVGKEHLTKNFINVDYPHKWKEEEIKTVIEIQNKYRPKCYNDHTHPFQMPECLHNCNDFDGMNYHHEWDKLIWKSEFKIVS